MTLAEIIFPALLLFYSAVFLLTRMDPFTANMHINAWLKCAFIEAGRHLAHAAKCWFPATNERYAWVMRSLEEQQ